MYRKAGVTPVAKDPIISKLRSIGITTPRDPLSSIPPIAQIGRCERYQSKQAVTL
jgi:hypothetical protein